MRPNYKNPHITNVHGVSSADQIAIHKLRLNKIQEALDANIDNGWTLVYYDKFLNTVVTTNGGNDVTEFDYAITCLIQSTIKNIMKKKK